MEEIVAKTETELYLRIEFEIRQIKVASESTCKEEIRCFSAKIVVVLLSHIECRHHASGYIWPGVAITQPREFEVEGQHD